MEPFIAEIKLFGGNFAPRGWAYCDGQLLAISSNTALFSILGTIYGGDGRTSFALPDLRGRVAISPGHGPGLSSYNLGAKSGVETVTLNQTQMPQHNHILTGSVKIPADAGTGANTDDPTNNYIANDGNSRFNSVSDSFLGPVTSDLTIGNNGGNLAHPNMQPYLAVNYIIALVGVFPSRS